MNRYIKKFIGTALIASFLFVIYPVNSQVSVDNFDTKLLTVQFNSVTKPKNLYITPLSYKYSNSDKLSSSVFFYFIDKLGFPQSPVQYLIDSKGNLNRLINIDEDFTDTIVIGVDSNLKSLNENVVNQVSSIANKYEIARENILVKSIFLSSDKKRLVYNDLTTDLTLNDFVNKLSTKQKLSRNRLEFSQVIISQTNDPGITVDVTVKFKNNSDVTLYKDDAKPIFLQTVGDRESELGVNGQWLSKSKAGELVEQKVRTGEIGTIKFQVLTPLQKGQFVENFVIADKDNELSKSFSLSLNVKDVGQKVFKIVNGGYGFVMVKDNPSYTGASIGSVYNDDKALYLDKQGAFYRVKIPSKKIEGWIPSYNLKEL